MFQQPRVLHRMDSVELLMHQKMSERMLLSPQQTHQTELNLETEESGNQTSISSKRLRVEQSTGNSYDHSPAVNFYPIADPSTSSVVLTRTEYEAMRQEIINLKRTLSDFRGCVDSEIELLKKENKLLKNAVSQCTCGCRVHNSRSNNNQTSKVGGRNTTANSDKSIADGCEVDVCNAKESLSPSFVNLLQTDNKNLKRRNHELDKQLRMLQATAASSRMPPLPSSESLSFLRELVSYYSLLDSSPSSSSSGGNGSSHGDGTDTADVKDPSYVSLLSLDGHHDRLSSVSGAVGYAMGFDAHAASTLFANGGFGSSCPVYNVMPEVFDAEKGLQVQLIVGYNVWVSKSKLQFVIKEASTQKEGAPLFVLRRLIPLVFTWEELAASRGQGLNCKSTEDMSNKEPLDPTKVLVCKAFMRKFCVENGHAEPLEKSVNETFSHQVNYARRKFKARAQKSTESDGSRVSHQDSAAAIPIESFNQSQCVDSDGTS